jgi:hypothetical protein
MENYFTYFTEIEEHYQRRRGTGLLLSTLDWALIETWKDAGIPLEAVLRGIDETFDKYDRKPARAKTRKVNSLAYCSQEVLAAADDMKEAATGAVREKNTADAGFETDRVRAFLRANAQELSKANARDQAKTVANEVASRLTELADSGELPALEDLERQLTMLEEKMFGALLAATPDSQLVEMRAEADREIAPYRSKMSGAQLDQLQRQFVNKRLLERARIPRLSLFYL